MKKEYLFVQYEPTTKLEDIQKWLSTVYEAWTVVSFSQTVHGMTVLLVK